MDNQPSYDELYEKCYSAIIKGHLGSKQETEVRELFQAVFKATREVCKIADKWQPTFDEQEIWDEEIRIKLQAVREQIGEGGAQNVLRDIERVMRENYLEDTSTFITASPRVTVSALLKKFKKGDEPSHADVVLNARAPQGHQKI